MSQYALRSGISYIKVKWARGNEECVSVEWNICRAYDKEGGVLKER